MKKYDGAQEPTLCVDFLIHMRKKYRGFQTRKVPDSWELLPLVDLKFRYVFISFVALERYACLDVRK